MARKKKNKNKSRSNQANQSKSQPRSQPKKTENPKEIAKKLDSDLDKVIDDNSLAEDVKKVVIAETDEPSDISLKSAKEIYHKALVTQKTLEKKINEYENQKEKLHEEKTDLESEKSLTEELKKQLNEKLDKYNAELTEINQLRVDGSWSSVIDKKLLDHYEETLKEQEKVLTDKISDLNDKHTKYVSLLADAETTRMDSESEFQSLLNKEKEKLENVYQEKFNSKSEELDNLSKELEEKT